MKAVQIACACACLLGVVGIVIGVIAIVGNGKNSKEINNINEKLKFTNSTNSSTNSSTDSPTPAFATVSSLNDLENKLNTSISFSNATSKTYVDSKLLDYVKFSDFGITKESHDLLPQYFTNNDPKLSQWRYTGSMNGLTMQADGATHRDIWLYGSGGYGLIPINWKPT